jgi:hypothetical protein
VPQVQKQPRTRLDIPICCSFVLFTCRYSAVDVIPFRLSRKDISVNSSILLAFPHSCSPVPAPAPSLSSLSSSESFLSPTNLTLPLCTRCLRRLGRSLPGLFALPDVNAWKCRPHRLLLPGALPSPTPCSPPSLRTISLFLAALPEFSWLKRCCESHDFTNFDPIFRVGDVGFYTHTQYLHISLRNSKQNGTHYNY